MRVTYRRYRRRKEAEPRLLGPERQIGLHPLVYYTEQYACSAGRGIVSTGRHTRADDKSAPWAAMVACDDGEGGERGRLTTTTERSERDHAKHAAGCNLRRFHAKRHYGIPRRVMDTDKLGT